MKPIEITFATVYNVRLVIPRDASHVPFLDMLKRFKGGAGWVVSSGHAVFTAEGLDQESFDALRRLIDHENAKRSSK